jgi:hypothetical protein
MVAACGETRVLETMGMGKQVPDETQVRTGTNLTLPPDLQLRTPSNAPAAETQIAPTTVSSLPQPLPDPPADALTGSLDSTPERYDAAAPPASATPATAPDTLTTAPPAVRPAAAGDPRENAFVKYGISKTYPDGKPKSEKKLNEELLAAIKEEKRRQDPKYGTIFNIGDLFGGD